MGPVLLVAVVAHATRICPNVASGLPESAPMLRRMTNHPASRSRRLWWPLWVAISLPALDVGVQAISVNYAFVLMWVEIPLLFLWAVAAAVALGVSVHAFLRGEWQIGFCLSVLPVFVVTVLLHLIPVSHACNDIADTIHFSVTRWQYARAVEQLPHDGRRLAVFELGGMIWASRGLVYDETDQVTRDRWAVTPDWAARAKGTELSCGYTAYPLPIPVRWWSEHWYLASFGC